MTTEIIEQFFEKYDLWFSINKKEIVEQENKNQNLLHKFLERFTFSYIQNMEIDDYAVGKGGDPFCNWVEMKLQDYGDIHAQRLNAWQKFGIYYSAKDGNYQFGSKFGRDEVTVFNSIKQEILNVIKASNNHDYPALAKSKLNPLFKNKIFFLYNPNDSLPIYSDTDLQILLTVFEIPFNRSLDRAFRRKALFEFYQSLNRTDISTFRFMKFVYNSMGYRSALRNEDAFELTRDINPKAYSLVDIHSLEELIPNSTSSNRSGLVNEKPESVVQKKLTGKKGEEIVKAYLLLHKDELGIVGEPYFACEVDDYKHYDISYTHTSGKTIYIEVKATKANSSGQVHFEMSDKEYDFMLANIDNYYFFYINDVFNGDVINRISARCIVARPSKYKITMKINN